MLLKKFYFLSDSTDPLFLCTSTTIRVFPPTKFYPTPFSHFINKTKLFGPPHIINMHGGFPFIVLVSRLFEKTLCFSNALSCTHPLGSDCVCACLDVFHSSIFSAVQASHLIVRTISRKTPSTLTD